MSEKLSRRTALTLVTGLGLRAEGASDGIRAGCQTRAYGSPIRDRALLPGIYKDLAETGFEGFETKFASLEYAFAVPEPARREIEKYGLALIGLHAGFRLQPQSADVEKAQRIARGIRDLGGKHFICSGPGLPRTAAGIDEEAMQTWCGHVSRMGRYCREIGVRFCLHNHGAELAHGAAELQAVMERTDAREVSLLLDLSYFPDAGLQAGEWVSRYASRLAGLHLREHVGGKEVMLGEGSLDAGAVAAALRKASWSGWVILEVNKRADMPSRELVAHGRRYMRERMKV